MMDANGAPIPDPSLMDEGMWISTLTMAFPGEPMPTYNEDLDVYVSQLIVIPTFASRSIPQTREFTDWREWARIFKQVMES